MAADSKSIDSQLAELEVETKRIQLESARISLEQTKEQIADYNAKKEARSQQNRQRQAQLRTDLRNAATQARKCTHKQGGSIKAPNAGQRESTLSVAIYPDERVLISCPICHLRVWSPRAVNKSEKRRRGESDEQMRERVEQYSRDLEVFDQLLAQAQNKLTDEAARPMHCGVTFKFEDADGRPCDVPSPCDKYAQGQDNRKVA